MIDQPTIQEISENIVAQISSKISQAFPLLPKAFVRVLAKSLAGLWAILFRYCGWILLQMFVEHASFRETTILGKRFVPLIEWGRAIGVGDPALSEQAELVIEITVLSQTGSLPGNTQVVFPATGVVYLTSAAVALNAPVVQATIKASSDQDGGDGSGQIGNLEAGDIVEFANRPPSIAAEATVLSMSVQGADSELEGAYRGRVVRRFQRRPQGGAYADYQAWGEEPAGILNVYPYTGSPGEVDVFVEATAASAGNADGIPTQAQLEEVADFVDLSSDGLATRRPVNAAINILPITRTPFNVVLQGVETENVSATHDSLSEGVDDFLRTLEPMIVGLTPPPRRDRITQGGVAGQVQGIATAEGATVAVVNLMYDGLAINEYALFHGEKAKLGDLSIVGQEIDS